MRVVVPHSSSIGSLGLGRCSGIGILCTFFGAISIVQKGWHPKCQITIKAPVMSHLFEPLRFRDIEFCNRIFVSPMCQYSCENGFANDWHFVHLATRAVGRAALVMAEATAVTADSRISPKDLGIWSDAPSEPWKGGHPLSPGEGGWTPIYAPSAIPFAGGYQTPHAMTVSQIALVVDAFAKAAGRALAAGAKLVEIHSAHGYLLHSFLSPLSNRRSDQYGGSFENRIRILCDVITAVRKVWPERYPLSVRISCTDWVDGG